MKQRIDRILQQLNDAETLPRNTYVKLSQEDLIVLCSEAINTLKKDETLLELEAPITVFGDIHGQFYDLLTFMKRCGKPPETNLLFLGDYVDRGRNSIETFAYLLAMKVKYPDHVWLLRGNHETRDISQLYGFWNECTERYGPRLWERFVDVFSYLPLAAVISNRIFCVHGGLSKGMTNLETIKNMKRPIDIPDSGPLADLLWADPSNDHKGFVDSERGTSYTYGVDVVEDFLKQNDFDLICRAHQVVEAGFEFPYHPNQSVLTVFSAPDYCEEFGNKGAVLKVDPELRCSFIFVDPPNKKKTSLMRQATPQRGRRY